MRKNPQRPRKMKIFVCIIALGALRPVAPFSPSPGCEFLVQRSTVSRCPTMKPRLSGHAMHLIQHVHPHSACTPCAASLAGQVDQNQGVQDHAGDVLQQVRVVYQDEHLAVLSKPGGMLMHRSRDAPRESVFFLQTARDKLGKRVFLANRIDRGTSGTVELNAWDLPHSREHVGVCKRH